QACRPALDRIGDGLIRAVVDGELVDLGRRAGHLRGKRSGRQDEGGQGGRDEPVGARHRITSRVGRSGATTASATHGTSPGSTAAPSSPRWIRPRTCPRPTRPAFPRVMTWFGDTLYRCGPSETKTGSLRGLARARRITELRVRRKAAGITTGREQVAAT